MFFGIDLKAQKVLLSMDGKLQLPSAKWYQYNKVLNLVFIICTVFVSLLTTWCILSGLRNLEGNSAPLCYLYF